MVVRTEKHMSDLVSQDMSANDRGRLSLPERSSLDPIQKQPHIQTLGREGLGYSEHGPPESFRSLRHQFERNIRTRTACRRVY